MRRLSMSRSLVPEASEDHRRYSIIQRGASSFCPPLVGVVVGAPHLLRACVSGAVSFGGEQRIGRRDYWLFAGKGSIVLFEAIGILWESSLTPCTFGSNLLLSFKVIFNLVASGSGVEHPPGVQEVRGPNP